MMKELPKLVITDIDGVWTDGGMYYDQTGNEWKKFNTGDSAGVLYLRTLSIPFAIITGEDTKIVANRAKKLQVENLFMGVKDKVNVAEQLLNKFNIDWKDVAFIGDDLGDMKLLRKVGFSAAPSSAPDFVTREVDYVTKKKGGEGAFREFVEMILTETGLMDKMLDEILAD